MQQSAASPGAAGAAVKIEARNVTVVYRKATTGAETMAVQDLNLQIREGEFVAIVGPSGCGKTTFLKCLDGLIGVSAGELLLDGKLVTKPGSDRAMVFQNPSLLPWRSVLRNVTYGLELQRVPLREAQERAMRLIKLVGLEGFHQSYPSELSGGMQQRVNLARALAVDPEALLLDEPFAALDAQTREFMQLELLRVWRANRKTAVFVTHQISEAVFLADRVLVFTARPGRLRADIRINLPRPRQFSMKREPEFLRCEGEVWAHIEEEVHRSGMFLTVEEAV